MFVLKLLKLSTVWFAKVCTTVIDKLSCAIWWRKKSHMIYKKQKSYRYNIRQKGCGANRCNGKQRIYKLLRNLYVYFVFTNRVIFFLNFTDARLWDRLPAFIPKWAKMLLNIAYYYILFFSYQLAAWLFHLIYILYILYHLDAWLL